MSLTKVVDGLIKKNAWSTPSTITLTPAISGVVTKGTIVDDEIQYMMIPGTKLALIRFVYAQSTAGANGNGITLFTLPGGLQADSTYVDFYSTYANTHIIFAYHLLGSVGAHASGNASGLTGSAVMSNATQFYIHGDVTSNSFVTIGGGYGLMASANARCAGWFVVPVI